VMSLLGNAVAGGLRGWVLQEPEGQMQEAELRDRANRHVGRILRCVVWFGLGGWCWGCWAGG
jgi:hypothetical protein